MDRQTKLSELTAIVSRDMPDCLANQDCKETCMETIAMLSSRKKIEAVCLHEAGHFAESIKLGVMVGFKESDIGYHPPRVIYCTEKLQANKYEANPGAIYTPFKALEIRWTVQLLQQAARVAVAGGVYAHVLANRPIDEGTDGDCELFKNYYRIAHNTLHAHPDLLIASKLWKWAIREVRRDLKKRAELKDDARRIAAQFIRNHYRPFIELCNLTH